MKRERVRPHSNKQIIEALEISGGRVAEAAQRLKMSYQGIYQRLSEDKELRDALEDIRERDLDTTESQLKKAVKRGEGWAICFKLKCQGKHRGWVERAEITGKDGESFHPKPEPQKITEGMSQEEATRIYMEQLK